MITSETLHLILIAVGILAVVALTWMLVELSATLRRTRRTVVQLHESLDPTLANVKSITDTLQPAVAKVDPLLERVQLTVDAANLEIMRLDTIMGNLEEVSGALTSTVSAVDSIANAPLNLVNKATAKINGVLGTARAASEESVALGAGKPATPAPQLAEPVPVEEKLAKAAEVARTVRAGYVTLVGGAKAAQEAAGQETAEQETAPVAEAGSPDAAAPAPVSPEAPAPTEG